MQKLVLNRDYTNLTLKSIKFIADILTAFVPDNGSPPFTPFSTNDISPTKGIHPFKLAFNYLLARNNSACSVNTKGLPSDTSPISSALTQSPRYGKTSGSTKRNSGYQTPVSSGRIQSRNSISQSEKGKGLNVEKQNSAANKKDQKSLYLPSRCSAATFGGSGKSRSIRSSLAVSLSDSKPAAETPSLSRRSNYNNNSQRQDISPIEKFSSALGRKDSEHQIINSVAYSRDAYQDKNAAEIELLQRDRDLIEKERELIEKKRELMAKARELEEKELAIQEQKLLRANERKVSNASNISQKSGFQPKTSPFEAEDNRLRAREDESDTLRLANSMKPILRSQVRESDKDTNDRRNPTDENLSHSSSTLKLRTAKEASEALREKSKHLAKVLTRVSSYDGESRIPNNRSI